MPCSASRSISRRRGGAVSAGCSSRRSAALLQIAFLKLGLLTEDDYVAAYCRRTGRERIQHWNHYLAFSLFRPAAIARGVYRRGLAGNSSNPESIKMSKVPRERAELAWSLAS